MSVFDEISRALSGKSPVGAQVVLKVNYCLKYSCAVTAAALSCVICVFAAWVIAHYRFMYSFVKRTPTGSTHQKKQKIKKNERAREGEGERGSTTKCIFNLSRIVKFKSSHSRSCFEIQSAWSLSMQAGLMKKKIHQM